MRSYSSDTHYPDPKSLVPGCRLGESVLKNPLQEICTVGSVRGKARQFGCRASPARRRAEPDVSLVSDSEFDAAF
jgi:hypothetical protein